MSAHVTRKRCRDEEEDQDLPPAKREPAQEGADGPAGNPHWHLEADGQPRDGQVSKEDEEFWFEDGTVILVARNVEFRVYKGVLAGLSPVFKDLFAERHPLRNVRMDGVPIFPCPVVHVLDSPQDLRHLLRACFPKRLGSLYGERNPSYHEISAAVRLGAKYKITELYSQSLEYYLKFYFPSTFKSWDELTNYVPPGWRMSEAIGVVNLARITGELSILPAAFIACICAKSGIGHGITREDGSQEHLSPGDLNVCLVGKTRICATTITMAMRTFKPAVSPECKTSSACKKALRDVLLNLEEKVDKLTSGNPFTPYEHFIAGPGDLAVCPPCTAMVRQRNKKEQEDVWNRLPELLDIDVPGWGTAPPPPPPQLQGDAT